jgi:hypothetical protein
VLSTFGGILCLAPTEKTRRRSGRDQGGGLVGSVCRHCQLSDDTALQEDAQRAYRLLDVTPAVVSVEVPQAENTLIACLGDCID